MPSISKRGKRPGRAHRLTREEVQSVVGPIDDVRAAAIIATGASLEELEEAAAWAAGESDVLGDQQLRGSVVVAAVYDILTAEEKFPDDRD